MFIRKLSYYQQLLVLNIIIIQHRVSLSFLDLISPLVPKQQFWGIDLSNFKIYLLNQGPLKQRDGIAHVRLSKTLKEIEVFQHFFEKKV